MDRSTYKPEQVNLNILKRKSDAGVTASITRLGVLKDENSVDPYDNTPSFAKNKELSFKSKQTGYTNSLLEKILESQTNKDAWNATQEYHKKSLEYLEKISSKMSQLVPDKKEEYEDVQKAKARCSAITKALLSGDSKTAMKMASRGIMDAITPWQLQTAIGFAQSVLSFSSMEELVAKVGDTVSNVVINALPQSIGFTLEQMRGDLPSVIDAQFIQLFNSVSKFTKKTKGGNLASNTVLEILRNMGVDNSLGESTDNLTANKRNFKERMPFDRAFYETVTNGIPQQLARIEQAIRGGHIFYWEAQKGQFKRMDNKAFGSVLTPDTARVQMNKNAAYNFMNDIVDNYELNGAAFKSGIRIVESKKGNRVIDSELVTEVFGIKWHDLLTRHDIAAKLTAINSKTTVEEISAMIGTVIYTSSWNGYGFNQLGQYKRIDVEEADKAVAKHILRLLMNMRTDYKLKRAILNQAKEEQEAVEEYADRLSYSSEPGIDIQAAIQSGATNMAGAMGSRRGAPAKSSISKRLQSIYSTDDKEQKYEENKSYATARVIKAINEITGTSTRYGYGAAGKLGNEIDLALKKKFLDTFKSPKDYETFINKCLDDDGNLDSDKFTKEMARFLSKSRNEDLKDIYKQMKAQSGFGKTNRKEMDKTIAEQFYDTINHGMRTDINLKELADAGSTLIADILDEENVSLKKLGLTVGGVTMFTKKFLAKEGIIKNPVAGTILGSMLSAGAIFVQHTKYFQTLTGQDKNAYDSDGVMTNQERVMADLLTNKVGPLLAGLGVGKGINKLFKKMGPIGKLVGLPAAIITGTSAFAAASFAKNTFGDAIVGDKQEDGTRRAKGRFARLIRHAMSAIPGMDKLLEQMDKDADIAEENGQKFSEYTKSLKDGGLYREGTKDVKIDENGNFTVSGDIADDKGNFTRASASGNIKTDKLKNKVTELKVVLKKMGDAHSHLSKEDLQFLASGELQHVVSEMKSGANVATFIKAASERSPKLGEYVKWYLRKSQLEMEIDKDIKTAAVTSFDDAIKNSELSKMDSDDKDALRDKYVNAAIRTFKTETIRGDIFPESNKDTSTLGRFKNNLSSAFTLGKIGILNKFAGMNNKFISGIAKDQLAGIEEADKKKYAVRNALLAGQGLDGLFDENGIIKNGAITDAEGNYTTESGEIINEETGKVVNLTEGAYRTSTAHLQTTMAESLTQIASQIGRLFYEDLPVIMRGFSGSSTEDDKTVDIEDIGLDLGEEESDETNYIDITGGGKPSEAKPSSPVEKIAKKLGISANNPIINNIAQSYISQLSPEAKKDPLIASIIGSFNGDMPQKEDGIDISQTSLNDTINEINANKVTSKLTDVPIVPTPTVNVLDIPAMTDIDNPEKYREARTAVNSLISSLPSEQREVYQKAFSVYDKTWKKPGTKKENEQAERLEEKQEKVLDMQIAGKGGISPEDLKVGDKAINIEDALAAMNGQGGGILGDLLGSAAGSFLGGVGASGLVGMGKGLLFKFLPAIVTYAPYVAATALTGYAAYKVFKYTADFLKDTPEKLKDLFDWNQETEGAEIDEEGNVTKEAETHSVNNAVHYFKDAKALIQGSVKLIGKMKDTLKHGKDALLKVGSKLLHPVKSIKELVGKFKGFKDAGGLKAMATSAINGVKKFAGAVAGVTSKICDFIANSKIINKIPGIGPAITSFFSKLAGKLGKFSDEVAAMLGPFFKKAGQEGAKEAGKKGLKKIPILNLALIGWSAWDGWRKAAAYLGLMPSNTKEKDLKIKPSKLLKFNVAFFKAVYDNFISMAGTYFGTAVAVATLGIGTAGSVAISLICSVLEAMFHKAISFPQFLEKVMAVVGDKEELKAARLTNHNLTEEATEDKSIESKIQTELTNYKDEDSEEDESINVDLSSEDSAAEAQSESKSVYDKLDEHAQKVKAEMNADGEGKTSFVGGLFDKAKNVTKKVISNTGIGLAYRAGKKALSWLTGNTDLPTYSGSDYEDAVSTLISNAESQVGYRSGYNSYNAYAKDVGAANNQAWCSTFQDWIFQKTFGKETAAAMLGGSGNQPSTWERAKKMQGIKTFAWNDGEGKVKPQPGDLVFFDFASGRKRHSNPTNHIGLVTKVNKDGTVDTIEGNTSMKEGNQTTGGRVARKNRQYIGGGSIVGFARPDWNQIGAKTDSITTAATPAPSQSSSTDGKLQPGEAAGFMDTLGSIERGIDTIHRGTRAIGTAKRSAEAIKRTMSYTKEANKGKSFWEKARNNTRAIASSVGSAAQVVGAIGHVMPNSSIGNVARQVSDTMNVADRYARTAARQMDMVGSVITNVQTKTAGGIIDAVQTSGHILSSGFGGLIKGMDYNTRKLDQMCNTGDRTIRVLEEIKGILGRGNFIADNQSTAAIS